MTWAISNYVILAWNTQQEDVACWLIGNLWLTLLPVGVRMKIDDLLRKWWPETQTRVIENKSDDTLWDFTVNIK